ncbi:ankyrin repeat-containing domain protein [Diaporthe sp. PMI_573]|nr:ankyrin repeat-containing domain protein [Diaporthaceae sp. PMI_573]
MRLLGSNGNTEQYRNWCRLYDPTNPWRSPNVDRDSFAHPLYYVSTFGLDPLVSRFLDEGAEPALKKTELHASCLQSAAYNGHHRVVELLLEAGTDPNAGNDLFDCPLKAATAQGYTAIMKLLLKYGANPDGNNWLAYDEGTPLLEACRLDSPLAAELLLNAGASPDRYERKGDDVNPLEAAAYRGSKECLRLLLPKASRSTALRGLEMVVRGDGCDINMLELFRDYVPDAVLLHAIALRFDNLADDILDCGVMQMDIDRSDDRDIYRRTKDYSPTGTLYCACETGSLPATERLIQEGVDVNGGHESYGPSLAVAAYKGHLNIVNMLIQSGCSLSDGEGIYGGPVQAAVLSDHLEVLRLLVSSGADINMPLGKVNRLCSTLPLSGNPLKAAIFTKNESLVSWLLDQGGDVNYGGGLGPAWAPRGIETGSPLMIAASHGPLSIVERLLEAGAEVNQRYEEYPTDPTTALEAACEKGQFAVVERLLDSGAVIERDNCQHGSGLPLFWAVKADSLAIVLLLLHQGVSPNALRHREKGQLTVLAQACKRNNAEIVSPLIEAGADVHQTSRFTQGEETPIQTAVGHSNAEVVRVLIKHGGRVNEQTSEGFKALHTAIWKGSTGILRVIFFRKVRLTTL